MFFRVPSTQANHKILCYKLHRFVVDIFPGILIVWLNSEDQEKARLEGVELTPHQSFNPAGTLVAVPVKGIYKFFLEELLKRKIEPVTPELFHVRLDSEELRALQIAGISYEVVEEQPS